MASKSFTTGSLGWGEEFRCVAFVDIYGVNDPTLAYFNLSM